MTRVVGLTAALLQVFLHQVRSQSSNIQPAAATILEQTIAKAPFLKAETVQLTDETLAIINDDIRTAELAHLFSFDNSPFGNETRTRSCKTFPGDLEWPSDHVWSVFNELLNGALISAVPVGAPCYDSEWGAKDQAKCNDVVSRVVTPDLHENDPTSIMFPIYQGRTCLPRNDTTSTDKCTLGGFPVYAVNVSNVAQIQLALNFARNTDIRVVIKNTGHCYLGKSSGAGALSIWMHNLKDIEYIPEYEGIGYSGPAMHVGAGVTVEEVYRAAEKFGGTVQGGICESVGYVGGYLQGGGHNPMSGYYGMAADSVLAYQVVTADGHFITASHESYPDLFWALRGGGGSTFGIVTSAIVKVHPKLHVTYSTFEIGNTTNQTISRDTFWKGIRKYWELYPTFTDAGTYSWNHISNTNGQLSLKMDSFFAPGHTLESYQRLTKPLFDYFNELGIPYIKPHNATFYPSFFPAYWDAWGKSFQPVGTASVLPANRLIPRNRWDTAEKFNTTFNVLMAHVNSGKYFAAYHQAPKNRQHADNAVSSAWRNAQAFIIVGSPRFAATATATEIGAADAVLQRDVLQPWRDVSPASEGGGSYLNEASISEPNWQEEFYGEQYERLLKIKKKFDPRGVFYATTGVGSEGWEVRDGEQGVQTQNGRLCRVGSVDWNLS